MKYFEDYSYDVSTAKLLTTVNARRYTIWAGNSLDVIWRAAQYRSCHADPDNYVTGYTVLGI